MHAINAGALRGLTSIYTEAMIPGRAQRPKYKTEPITCRYVSSQDICPSILFRNRFQVNIGVDTGLQLSIHTVLECSGRTMAETNVEISHSLAYIACYQVAHQETMSPIPGIAARKIRSQLL